MRDSRIDVARGTLIVGVVVGHFWERSNGWDGGVLRFALTALYAFHMPAFVFLTGMVAKPARTGRKVLGLLSILVAFQFVFVVFLAVAGHPLKEWYWPYWVLWFLMAMVWWQLLTPLIAKWPRIAFAVAIVAALAVGLAEPAGNWFTYQRAVVFLPLYVAGMAWGPGLLNYLQGRSIFIKGGLVATFGIAALGLFPWNPEPHWLFHNWTYHQLGIDPVMGGALRAAVLTVGVLGTFALLAMTPGRAASLAWIGQRTLPVFIFHVFAVLAYGWYVFPLIAGLRGGVLVVLCTVVGVAVACVFATRPFVEVTSFIRSLPERRYA